MIFHTFLSLEMSFLSRKVPIFDIWIYLYYGFRMRKKETGGDSLFILDRVDTKYVNTETKWYNHIILKPMGGNWWRKSAPQLMSATVSVRICAPWH